ncbi:hypothetical protein [Dactylosporangium salmoneum]|uniref:MmyB-like transcription regulator ligand binding domain-containing protein n=1 Tax=Dactylosporangium salmoneum TaxID=53361 RepID=A0ABP5UPR6_9ACTN
MARAELGRFAWNPLAEALLGDLRRAPNLARRRFLLDLHCDVLTVPDDDQQVVFITAAAGSSSERALRALRQS